jgi:hypothetical protein
MKEGGHWYDIAGNACHTILSAKGDPRPTTLRDSLRIILDNPKQIGFSV